MADSKDDRRSIVHAFPLKRSRDLGETSAAQAREADASSPDPLIDALQQLAEEMLDEPVPDRLLDALRKTPPKKD